MAPRETRIQKASSFTPLSGGAAQALRESLKAKSSENGGVKKGEKSPAKAAAEAKAAAKAKIEERKKAEELGWVSFDLQADGVDFTDVEFTVTTADGLEFPGFLTKSGFGSVPRLKPGPVTLKVALPKPAVAPQKLDVELVDEAGDPLAHADYELSNDKGTKITGTTDVNGRFGRNDLDAGAWNLKVLEAGPSQRRIELEFVDENGAPLANLPIFLSKDSGTRVRKVLDGHGRLVADGLKPGSWSVKATLPDSRASTGPTRSNR